jgi:hypothetical protein
MTIKKMDQPTRRRAGVKRAAVASLRAIGVIRSILKTRTEAPKQGSEGAPDGWLEVSAMVAQGLVRIAYQYPAARPPRRPSDQPSLQPVPSSTITACTSPCERSLGLIVCPNDSSL